MIEIVIVALGESDCESLGSGFLAQPVNAISSLAFTVLGVMVWFSVVNSEGRERVNRAVFGALLFATGVGSFLFHGPQGPASHFLHDVTILLTIVALALMNGAGAAGITQRRTFISLGVIAAVVSLLLMVWPTSTNIIAAVAIVGLAAVDVAVHRSGFRRSRRWIISIVAMILALAFFLIGRTGGPLCDSSSLFQGHALWHILAAGSVWSYFEATTSVRIGRST